jgi:molybdopterin-guanine dinucleotide biosynthesis protein A
MLYYKKLENLEEMETFLDAFDLPILNQEDINHLNRSTTTNEAEAVMKSLPKKEEPRTGWIHHQMLPDY